MKTPSFPHDDRSRSADISESTPEFDGIICFGGVDWWYHNRGHYDLQIMQGLSKHVPILYVNSIGMRAPNVREGTMFITRVFRKLRSLGRGLAEVRPRFFVYSVFSIPGGESASLLVYQVKRAAKKCGIRSPLVWVACPPAASIVDELEPAGLVYQRTDRYEEYPGIDRDRIASFDQILKSRADMVVFCARELYESEKKMCKRSALIDHGVDFDHFRRAAVAFDQSGSEPDDMLSIPYPRVGFIGGIDAHTFDSELFNEVVRLLPGTQFVLVGACSLAPDWCRAPNVHQLGRKPYDEVASYMAACDVLIMPWKQNEWIEACNPVKLKEYMAVGRPIVSTSFPELAEYAGHVKIAASPEDFARLIRDSAGNPGDPRGRRDRVRKHTWATKAERVLNQLPRFS